MTHCSIIIVTFNGRDMVRQCLEALKPEVGPGVDVTIVDNGSTDGLPDAVRGAFPWVTLIETGRNLGFAAGNNLGISRTHGEFVLLLNSDVIVQSGFVEQILRPFATDPRLGSVAATMVFQMQPEMVASAGIEVYRNGLALDRALGQRRQSLTDLDEIFGPSAGAAAYRREALEDAGLFPESFFMYLEDVDLAWRMRLRGWRSLLSTGAVAEHAYSASSGEGSRLKRRLLARNRLWYVARCVPGWILANSCWRIAGYDLLVMASAPVRRDGASVTGRIEAFCGLTGRLRERREIQSRITTSRSEIERWIGPSPSAARIVELRKLARLYAASKS